MTEISFIILLVIIGVYCISHMKISNDKLKNNPKLTSMTDMIVAFLGQVGISKKEYFTKTIEERLVGDYREAYEFFTKYPYSKIETPQISEFKQIYANIDSDIKKWNEEYIEKELVKNEELFSNIDGKSLDEQQRRAVVVDETNNLVIAGAGSGKTLTISGKVKYLVDTKNIKPEEILLISFTKKSSDEMFERISGRLNINIESRTFHKLGLDIIKKHQGMRFDIEIGRAHV